MDSVSLLCITDLHGDLDSLQRILDRTAESVDIALLGGDLTNFGTVADAEQVIAAVQKQIPSVFAVAGNCDSPTIDARLVEMGISLFGKSHSIGRLAMYGVSAMPPWRGRMYELTEDEIESALSAGRLGLPQLSKSAELDSDQASQNDKRHDLDNENRPIEIILSHPPPHETKLDVTSRGVSVGSRALRRHTERYQPDLVVCGHIHEARGIDQLGASRLVNCGAACAGHFGLVHIADEIHIELQTACRR